MECIYIRLDGVVGDCVSRYVYYFNMMGTRKVKLNNIYSISQSSQSRINEMNFIISQPEPYSEMKINDDTVVAIKNFRDLGHEVIIFTDETQRKIKQTWVDFNLSNENILWITTNDLVDLVEDSIVVTTQFSPPHIFNEEKVIYYSCCDTPKRMDHPRIFTRWCDFSV